MSFEMREEDIAEVGGSLSPSYFPGSGMMISFVPGDTQMMTKLQMEKFSWL